MTLTVKPKLIERNLEFCIVQDYYNKVEVAHLLNQVIEALDKPKGVDKVIVNIL